ncbi:MAG: hypothetical protein R8P61_30440 [Bacteroidia bacterium]|nr:hypothetical protein [Bacteroidia bacterium]
MKSFSKIAFLLFLLSPLCFLPAQSTTPLYWTWEKAQKHAHAQNDPQKWDQELLEEDMEYIETDDNSLPIHAGVFPVALYDTPGTGGSNSSYFRKAGKSFMSKSFIVNKGEHNAVYLGEERLQEVYFTFVLLTDFIDTVNYSHATTYAESRNHPHYICEGTLKTQKQNIDFLAMMTGDRNNYAVINMRFFDLRFGQTILIAPQKDGSLRFLQVESPGLNSITAKAYVEKLLDQREILHFFEQAGNI